MNEQTPKSSADNFKLLIAAAFLGGGIWAYDGVKGLPPYVNLAFPIGGVLIALLIVFFWCDMGRRLLRYIRDSTTEVKKVVWEASRCGADDDVRDFVCGGVCRVYRRGGQLDFIVV
nr:hypothetical protein LVJ77_07600 [Conchiformibius kuhniae]